MNRDTDKIAREREQWARAYIDLYDWLSRIDEEFMGGEYSHGDCIAPDEAREQGRLMAFKIREHLKALKLPVPPPDQRGGYVAVEDQREHASESLEYPHRT